MDDSDVDEGDSFGLSLGEAEMELAVDDAIELVDGCGGAAAPAAAARLRPDAVAAVMFEG